MRGKTAGGVAPYREKGLNELLRRQVHSGRFSVVDTPDALAQYTRGVFLCLPTPSLSSGRIDLRPLKKGTAELGRALRAVKGYRVVVVKSTVVPGTTETVVEPILRRLSGKSSHDLGVAANPEFLAEGTMVRDALSPQRIVVGAADPRSRAWLRRIYRDFRAQSFFLTPSGAELVKYASNAFLAQKVSFANEISRLTERLYLDVDEVMQAVGANPRIGQRFLSAGPGFGGSCFEKDLKALIVRARELGVRWRSGEVTLKINDEQAEHVMALVHEVAGPLGGKTVTVLGLTFKAGTDDIRELRAFPLITGLVAEGARVRVHDPVALENFRREWERRPLSGPGKVDFESSVSEALERADVAILQADWSEYLRWRPEWTRRMKRPLLIDLRRALKVSAKGFAGLQVFALGVGSGFKLSLPSALVDARRTGGFGR